MSEKYTFWQCRRCGNQVENDRIYQCPEGHLFCQKCARIGNESWCPYLDCWLTSQDYIGRINRANRLSKELTLSDSQIGNYVSQCPRCLCNTVNVLVYTCPDGHPFCDACQKTLIPSHNLVCPWTGCPLSLLLIDLRRLPNVII